MVLCLSLVVWLFQPGIGRTSKGPAVDRSGNKLKGRHRHVDVSRKNHKSSMGAPVKPQRSSHPDRERAVRERSKFDCILQVEAR